jgi:hypothetical protein
MTYQLCFACGTVWTVQLSLRASKNLFIFAKEKLIYSAQYTPCVSTMVEQSSICELLSKYMWYLWLGRELRKLQLVVSQICEKMFIIYSNLQINKFKTQILNAYFKFQINCSPLFSKFMQYCITFETLKFQIPSPIYYPKIIPFSK